MGFTEVKKIEFALDQAEGDVQTAIDKLTQAEADPDPSDLVNPGELKKEAQYMKLMNPTQAAGDNGLLAK